MKNPLTTLNEICTAVENKQVRIVSIEQTTKGSTAIVTLHNALQKEVPFNTALTLQGFYGVRIKTAQRL